MVSVDEKLLGTLLTAGVPLHLAVQIASNPAEFGQAVATVGSKSREITRDFTDLVVAPKKRKKIVSKYNRELGKQLKKLKKKHPKTAINKLMKRAHAATRKVLK